MLKLITTKQKELFGLESIIPTIYKAYKENYKIIFDKDLFKDYGVYQKQNDTTNTPIYSIDLQKEVIGGDEQKEDFIMAILYGKKYENFANVKNTFKTNLKIILNDEGIYDKIKNVRVKESIGIYYQEEEVTDGSTSNTENVPDANKTEKRIITYTRAD